MILRQRTCQRLRSTRDVSRAYQCNRRDSITRNSGTQWGLFQVGLDDVQHRVQLGLAIRQFRLVDEMIDEMPFDDGSHQAVHGAANGGDLLQDLDAIALLVQLALKRLRLPLNATNACQQLVLVSNRMHGRVALLFQVGQIAKNSNTKIL